MSVSKEVLAYTAKRVILSSSKPVKQVIADLNEELNGPKAAQIRAMLDNAKDREQIDKGMAELTNSNRPFVLFSGSSPSIWMNTYYKGEMSFEETWTFIFGNPVLAKEVLKHDMSMIGLYMPPRILVQEIKGGVGTKVAYQSPTTFLGDVQPDVVQAALEDVDVKMEELLTRVLKNTSSAL